MPTKRFYVTTPIYYVNDVPHIGHAYTTIASDVLARFKRLTGHDVTFLTGTDEHGQKIEKAAADRGESPKQLADRVMTRFQALWERLSISNTDFIRTTEPRHVQAVQAFFARVREKGDIYLGYYEDWYCVSDEAYWTELQLVDGKCPSCGRAVEKIKEESYFFRMSKYEKPLLKFLKSRRDFIQPESRRNEVIRFVEGGLRDLSVSRVSFKWGIPVPDDPRHVIYVWFDALTNYLTAIGYEKDPRRFKKIWPADVHVIGKDILRFHAVYWPCFLLSAGLPLPRQVFSHGWWTVDGEKMSKSTGNVVDPNGMVDRYGADAFRYFLLREVPFGEDGDFSESALIQRFNSELANDLGNLFSRALTMIERYANGRIPKPKASAIKADERKLKATAVGLHGKVTKQIDRKAFHLALREVWQLVDLANRYVERSAPWELAKDPATAGRLETVLYHLAESLRFLSLYLFAFMPDVGRKMYAQLGYTDSIDSIRLDRARRWAGLKPGQQIKKGAHLFPRLDAPEKPKKETTVEIPTPSQPTAQAAGPSAGTISIEEFRKLDLRVGVVTAAEKVTGADKLLKLQVDLGAESRQVVAGIATRYAPESLIGRKVIVVANLAPATIRGVESKGMILAAGDKEVQALASFIEDVHPGTRVK